jgi:predicted GNAT family N-acyltransferase
MKKSAPQDYEITTLQANPEYYNQTLELIEQELKYPIEHSFAEDFYPLFNQNNTKNLYIAIKNKKVVAHLGLKKRILVYKSFSYSVALLGGIVVHKKEQGSGLFTKLFEHILQKNKDDFLFYFLWSDLSSFYAKFNFVEFGLIREAGHVPYQDAPLKGFSKCSLANGDIKLINEIKALYNEMNQSFLHIERNDVDWEEIKKLTSAKFFYSNSRDYYVAHKGADLKGIIHESTITNLGSYLSWQPTTNIHSTDKLRYMGFIKIASHSLFKKFIVECSQGRLGILDQDEEKIKISYEDKSYVLGLQQFIQGIFGPSHIEELENLLPPIVVYGLDSV